MSVIRENLKEFYFVSPHWEVKSQRLLGTVGFEFELAERAFDLLFNLCHNITDSGCERWRVSEGESAEIAILSRAVIDHSVRVQKILKSMAKPDGEFWQLCESFFGENQTLFSLRDALHHVDTRVHKGVGLGELHPAQGDFSWKTIVPPDKLDCFWIAFGPAIIGEFAGPELSTSCTLRQPIDELTYRAHGTIVNLSSTFFNLDRFVFNAHSHFSKLIEKQLREQGIERNEQTEEKTGVGLHGRLRIGGLKIV